MTASIARNTMMPDQRSRTIIEGAAAIVIGLLLLVVPAQTMLVLVQLLGIYWLIAGVVMLAGIFINSSQWGWKLALGVLGIVAGFSVIQNPLWSTILVPAVLVVVLGIWGLMIGAFNIYEAFTGAGWGRGILGALSIFFGLVLLASPMLAAVALPFVLGFFSVAAGIATLFVAFRQPPAAVTPVRREERTGPTERAA